MEETNDDYFMAMAVELALQNPNAPFGAILVDRETSEVVARGLNGVRKNPLLHGEIDALLNYAASGKKRWHHLRLFTTAEPCCMCQAAAVWSKIPEVIYGTSIPTLVSLGWRQFELRAEDVVNHAGFSNCRITGGVLSEQCDQLFRNASSLSNGE